MEPFKFSKYCMCCYEVFIVTVLRIFQKNKINGYYKCYGYIVAWFEKTMCRLFKFGDNSILKFNAYMHISDASGQECLLFKVQHITK